MQLASHEELLIVSDLYYRGGTNLIFGKNKNGGEQNIVKALRAQDHGAFLVEALYGSNGDELPGNDERNFLLAEKLVKKLPKEEQQKVVAHINTFIKQNPAQAQKAHIRFEEINAKREVRGEEAIDYTFQEITKSSPQGNTEADGGGDVNVRAHTREDYNVRAHTRSRP